MSLNSDIKALIAKHGKEKVRALIDLRPVRTILFISYTTSSDPTIPVLCEVDETRYEVDEGYKIGWKPITGYDAVFSKETFYQSDFDRMVKDGRIKLYVEA
jgi:hypothetical protein